MFRGSEVLVSFKVDLGIELNEAVLYYIVLYSMVLYSIIIYGIILHYIILLSHPRNVRRVFHE